MISLKYALIERTAYGCRTIFNSDGKVVPAWPHPGLPHYHVVAHRCGYGDDLMSYCYEHDFLHLFLCEHLHDRPCPILRGMADGHELPGDEAAYEELAVQAFQRFLRGNERPMVGGVRWDGLAFVARQLLAGDRPWREPSAMSLAVRQREISHEHLHSSTSPSD